MFWIHTWLVIWNRNYIVWAKCRAWVRYWVRQKMKHSRENSIAALFEIDVSPVTFWGYFCSHKLNYSANSSTSLFCENHIAVILLPVHSRIWRTWNQRFGHPYSIMDFCHVHYFVQTHHFGVFGKLSSSAERIMLTINPALEGTSII